MNVYGESAIEAVRLCVGGQTVDPVGAWRKSTTKLIPGSKCMQAKGCPRGAFLGLCSAGLVRGIPAGDYTRSVLNKGYAVKAVGMLRAKPALAREPRALWVQVIGEERKAANDQMEVVIALWNNHLINREGTSA